MERSDREAGYDPSARGGHRKGGRPRQPQKIRTASRKLRFYGGSISATEVGCNLRCKFCFSDKPVWKPGKTGKFYSPQRVFDGLDRAAQKYGTKIISASASEGIIGKDHLFELLTL